MQSDLFFQIETWCSLKIIRYIQTCVPAGVAISSVPRRAARRGGCGVGGGGSDEAGQYPCVPICRAQLTVPSDKQLKYQ
ncbi:hypothetical protein J6590_018881 [Homalodisca vitripennis]|nr:hypothetical protein J6590_018881 [Homalodisca vitripennis]